MVLTTYDSDADILRAAARGETVLAPAVAHAVIAAAAMLGAGMQAPLASLTPVLELAHTGFQLVIP